MKAYVAVTDKRWFQHLRTLSVRRPVDEVNFWTPKSLGRGSSECSSGVNLYCSSSGARTTRSWGEDSSSTTPTSRSASPGRRSAKRTVPQVSRRFARGRLDFAEMIRGHGRIGVTTSWDAISRLSKPFRSQEMLG